MFEKRPKPEGVTKAILRGDRAALVQMGRRGAENKETRRDLEKETLEAEMLEQAKLYSIDEEGDVLPPDDAA